MLMFIPHSWSQSGHPTDPCALTAEVSDSDHFFPRELAPTLAFLGFPLQLRAQSLCSHTSQHSSRGNDSASW